MDPQEQENHLQFKDRNNNNKGFSVSCYMILTSFELRLYLKDHKEARQCCYPILEWDKFEVRLERKHCKEQKKGHQC